MEEPRNTNQAGMGFLGWLGIVFITLKLTGYIHWPWVWVLAPIWMPLALLVFIAIVIWFAYCIAKGMDK